MYNQNSINTIFRECISLINDRDEIYGELFKNIHERIEIMGEIHENLNNRLEFLEKKQVEIRTNICLQNRKIDKISLEKVSNNDFLESLRLISNDFKSATKWEEEFETKFALEMEEFRKTFARITKNHHKKIRNLENKNFQKISETENIF